MKFVLVRVKSRGMGAYGHSTDVKGNCGHGFLTWPDLDVEPKALP